MYDAIQTMPRNISDASFGRSYASHGDVKPEFRLPAGWWLLPAVVGGAGSWVMLFSAIFF
jgi:hypothetical protein